MISLRLLSESDKDLWEDFVRNYDDSGFMQTFWWAEFREKTGWDNFKIGIFQNNQLIGGSVLMKFHWLPTKNFLYIPEGPLIPFHLKNVNQIVSAFFEYLDQFIDRNIQKTSHLRIEPRLQQTPSFFNDFVEAPSSMEPRNTLLIDLTQAEEAILVQMKPKGRYNIGIAERQGIKIIEDSSGAGIKDFLDLYKQTLLRDGFSGKHESYFQTLIPHLVSHRTGTVFFAKYNGKPLATAVVVFFGDRATYFFGASSNEHRNLMAPYLLHWHIMHFAKNLGFKWYDFWGISPQGKTKHPWYKLSQFKQKFGGIKLNLIPTIDKIFDQKLYEEYLSHNKKKP